MSAVSRRDFTRLFTLGGSAALVADGAWAREMGQAPALAAGGPSAGEAYWASVRAQFVMPPELGVLNAANLCPASRPVLEALTRETRSVDADPSPMNRSHLMERKEATRRAAAAFLRVTPEEIVLTRNTSEANNMVSSGIDLKPGDEVVIFEDNHPSNHKAWTEKAKRWGFTVKTIPQINPHPGAEHYLDAYRRAITPKTRLISFTHLSSTVGDLFPAAELCALARERGVLSLVDGAQTLGLLDVDLAAMGPDFYTGSAHKWPCGARECGVLYINRRAQDRIWPSIYSAYEGAVGISRTFEGFGQRDEATMIAFSEAMAFQTTVGRAAIEQRSRALTQQLLAGLRKIDGVTLWTHTAPDRTAAVVSFLPGTLNAPKLAQMLYERDKVGVTTRGGTDRPGIRVSPHFYNSPAEVDRLLAGLQRAMKTGV